MYGSLMHTTSSVIAWLVWRGIIWFVLCQRRDAHTQAIL